MKYFSVLALGCFLSVGGCGGEASEIGVARSAIGTHSWARASISGPALRSAGIAYDAARGQIVLVGGMGIGQFGVVYRDTWTYTAGSWSMVVTAPSIGGASTSLAYDDTREQVLLFGGVPAQFSSPLDETWSWNGSSWSQRMPAHSAPGTAGGMLAYDSARQRFVLFGGVSSTLGTSGETWEYDDTPGMEDWVLRVADGAGPPARSDGQMTYDVARGQMVLFGGITGLNEYLDDTWLYDGVLGQWTEFTTGVGTPAYPPSRAYGSMTYDSSRGSAILVGGETTAGYRNDTWEFDGTVWAESNSAFPFDVLSAHAAYDAARDRTVALTYGSYEASGGAVQVGAQTWEYGVYNISCTQDIECASGHCADGYCCNLACEGTCMACNALDTGAGSVNGLCIAAIVLSTDPACDGYRCDGAGACLTVCNDETQCTGACIEAQCYEGAAHGTPCTDNAECAFGFCVDGYCCDAACDGECQACDGFDRGWQNGAFPVPNGQCLQSPANDSMPECGTYTCSDAGACRTSCTSQLHCDGDCILGTCVATSDLGTACTDGAQCSTGSCVDGYCCDLACDGPCAACDGADRGWGPRNGVCVAAPLLTIDPVCGNYACWNAIEPDGDIVGACVTSCLTGGSSGCSPSGYCSGNQCVSRNPNGQACTANVTCLSGNCVDGVCCNTACGATCASCNVAGSVGTCTVSPAGSPDDNCANAPESTCGTDGTCDGAGSCRKWVIGTPCSAGACSSSGTSQTNARMCNGQGICGPPTSSSCGAYACVGATCATTCSSDAHCANGNTCVAGVCQGGMSCASTCAQSNECCVGSVCVSGKCVAGSDVGTPCTDGGSCESGVCANGFCQAGAAPMAVVRIQDDGPSLGDAAFNVVFDGSRSTGVIEGWRWTFGDGSPTSDAVGPSHLYRAPGGYVSRLRITDTVARTSTAALGIQVGDGSGSYPPVVKIELDEERGPASLVVNYRCDCTLAPNARLLWLFGDGAESTEPYPTHTYAQAGAYEVSLYGFDPVTGLAGFDRFSILATQGDRVPPSVQAFANPPAIDLTATSPQAVVNLSAETLEVGGAIVSYRWTLDGETLATSPSFVQTFTAPKNYRVELEVTDDAGLVGHSSVEVVVTRDRASSPQFLSRPALEAKVGETYFYEPSVRGTRAISYSVAVGAPERFVANPGDGKIAWTPSADQAGEHDITLVATNAAGVAEQRFRVVVAPGKTTQQGCAMTVGASADASSQRATLVLLLLLGAVFARARVARPKAL